MPINLILLLYLILFAAFEIRAFTEFTRLIMMPLTPPLILSLVLFLPTIYLTWNGLQAICKFSQIVFALFALTILLSILLHNELHLSFLAPFGTAGFKPIFKAMTLTTFLFLGPELVTFIYPKITDKANSL
jgi:hypothetical protein